MFYAVHAGTKLYAVSADGTAVEIAPPTGVTINADAPIRFALLERALIVAGPGTSRPFQVDALQVSRLLTPRTPSTSPSLTPSGIGTLNGVYSYVVTFRIMSGATIISESPACDAVETADLTNQAQIDLSSIPTSTDANVNARAIYRTVGDGDVYFLVALISNNTATTYSDTTTDAALAINDQLNDDLGEPQGNDAAGSYFKQVTAWRDRAWGIPSIYPDRVHYTGALQPWAWSPDNYLTAKPAGQDAVGATGFAARRDELGVGKRRSLLKVVGFDESDFEMIQVTDGVGIWAPQSVRVIRDEAYFLGEDGVYRWGPAGVDLISRNRAHAWFTSDAYFNRARFSVAFAKYNQRADHYELHLAAAGSDTENRWVSFDLQKQTWWGPHKTDQFTPTTAGVIEDDDGVSWPLTGGSDGVLYKGNQSAAADAGTAIAFEIVTKRHSMDAPDLEKYWGELSVHAKAQGGGTLSIYPSVGEIDASEGAVVSHVLNVHRRRHRRMGVGKALSLRFVNEEVNQPIDIQGYEVIPVSNLGRR